MKRILPLLVLAAALAAGCASPLRGGSNPPADVRIVVSPDIAGSLAVEEVRIASGSVGNPRLQAIVRNLRNVETPFQYQVVWFDAHGMQIDTELSGWRRDSVQPKSDRSLPMVAPSREAVDFRLQFRADR